MSTALPQPAPGLADVPGRARLQDWLGPWAIWGLMTVLALGLVATAGLRMPYADEWRWLPLVAGRQPLTLHWLLEFDNEHRLVLPKLLYMGLAWLTGGDFRAGAFFSVAVLSAAAALLLAAVRRDRGGNRLADGFFPLVLLHWAQIDNLIWGFQLHFTLSVALILAVLTIVFRSGESLTVGRALAVAGCLLAAALSGPYGLAFLPPLGCWLAYAAATVGRSRRGSFRAALVVAALAAALLAAVPLLRLGCPISSDAVFPAAARSLSILSRLRVSAEFLANGFGPAAKQFWPISGFLVIAACAASAWALVAVFRAHPGERLRAAGMLAVLAGVASVALVIGWARAFLGAQAGFETRYITLAIPLVCLLYLQCQATAKRRAGQIQNALFALMCVLAVFDAFKGLRGAADLQTQFAALRQDAQAGIPERDLARRYTEENFILVGNDEFSGWLEILRSRGWYPYDPVPAARDPAQAICPMVDVSRAYEAPARVRLAAGQRFEQRFRLRQGGRLVRIDVQLGKWRWPRGVDEFVWQLQDADSPKEAAPLAKGRFDYRQCAHYRWATLWVPPMGIEAGRELELVLMVPADRPNGQHLEIPLYRTASPSDRQQMVKPGNLNSLETEDHVRRVDNPDAVEKHHLRAMLFLLSG